uniref:Putative wrky transcription factor protein 1 isoform x2 n=1 Tax=Ixodes ricinus TaxID=34613 RepID=A0A131XVT2_IXORI
MRSGKVSVGVSESSSELSAKPITARAKRSLAMARRGRNPCARYTSTSYDTASEGVASQSLSVSGTGCKLKRIARKELEKLRGLVDRQRNSYLRQLQREVERLNRLQELFLLAEDNRPTSSQMSTAASDSVEVSVERISTSNDSSSVGAQTSSSQLGSEQESAAKERYFVSVGMTTAKKKQRGGLSPFKKKSRTRRPGVAWVVPLETVQCAKSPPSEAPAKSNHVQANEDLSLQAAFAAHCGHLIQRFQARQLQVATLAKQRQHQQAPLLMHFHTKNNVQAQKMASQRLKQPRTFSHREMRDQTEKVYQKLPEVIDKKKRVHREQQYRANRLMAQVYNKAIQERALKGHINFAINRPSACL